ncbi:helix-turn-helix domain-containing protein [Halocatena marina]|uniref:helix-turn-helix domain-containing protein n=1 Tax=Halocatena marina TaxID=2934937 RepID=UPI00200C9B66|nr:helix-turn-helix domain-containing protein [Halocatena marina]
MSITRVCQSSSEEEGTLYKQVKLELQHPGCWTLAATEAHPGTHIIEKSLYPTKEEIKGDFILVSEGDATIDAFIETIATHSVVNNIAVLKRSFDRARVVVTYQRDSSIVPQIVNSEFMPIEPVHITGGQEYWTVLVRSDILSCVLNQMADEFDVEVEAIHEVDPKDEVEFADNVDKMYSGLSTRQRESLFEAQAKGYYQWPRDVSATQIAESLGVTGPTLLEHLRVGEQKILNTILDEMKQRYTRH